jgi:deazaflavin-dependent oxidoreductase (nitroreductase family)
MAVKVPPAGTRGTRFPRVLARLGNRFMLGQFRRGGARTQGGLPALLLETTGAKSGETRHAVLGYLEDGPDAWLVIAALAGAARHPAWMYNLARQPDAVVEFKGGRRVDVRAETLEGDQLAAAWARIGVDAPEFVGYRSKTDRELPVVRLRHRKSGRSTTGERSEPSRSTDSTTSSPGTR